MLRSQAAAKDIIAQQQERVRGIPWPLLRHHFDPLDFASGNATIPRGRAERSVLRCSISHADLCAFAGVVFKTGLQDLNPSQITERFGSAGFSKPQLDAGPAVTYGLQTNAQLKRVRLPAWNRSSAIPFGTLTRCASTALTQLKRGRRISLSRQPAPPPLSRARYDLDAREGWPRCSAVPACTTTTCSKPPNNPDTGIDSRGEL